MSGPRLQLKEIAESVRYGVTASACDEPVGPKFLRITDIQDGKVNWNEVPWCDGGTKVTDATNLRRGDIVFARTGATTGKSFLIGDCPENAVFASYLIRVRLREAADPGYISHFFKTADYWGQITKGARGVAQPGVNATTLKALKVPLPPLAEQKRIARILDTADGLRAKRRESITQLDTLLQSTFLDMFGDPVTNPMGWEVLPFESIGASRLGKMLDKGKEVGDCQFPYLANTNVKWGHFHMAELRTMDFSDADREEFKMVYGDLLICEGGEVGRTAIWRSECEGVFFQKALHRIRLDPSIAVPEYVFRFMWFMAKNGGFRELTNSATIAHLTGVKLKRLPFPRPPLDLQHRFAGITHSVERQEAIQRAHLDELDTLFASLQSRAFRGDL